MNTIPIDWQALGTWAQGHWALLLPWLALVVIAFLVRKHLKTVLAFVLVLALAYWLAPSTANSLATQVQSVLGELADCCSTAVMDWLVSLPMPWAA